MNVALKNRDIEDTVRPECGGRIDQIIDLARTQGMALASAGIRSRRRTSVEVGPRRAVAGLARRAPAPGHRGGDGHRRRHAYALPARALPDLDPDLLQDPDNVADTVRYLLTLPPESVIAKIMMLPMRETSWP
ncbi:MAG: hypothetical protein ACYC5S_08610 [Thiobacillus sp.]